MEPDTAAELEATREDDQDWLVFNEESLVFNEAFAYSKYVDIEEQKDLSDADEEISTSSSKEDTKELEIAHKLMGIVEVEESNFKKKALQQWTKELIESCFSQRDSSASFISVLKKRIKVHQRLHNAYIREQHRTKAEQSQSTTETKENEYPDVPIVLRLGVLTLFPLIESLSNVKEANYAKLCTDVLGILMNVLTNLPPLALHTEPADCLNAFRDFIYSLIKNNNFSIKTSQQAQSVVALVGLAISRGNARDLLLLIDVLFNIIKNRADSEKLKISHFLKQLSEHRKDMDVAALFDRGYTASWVINQNTADTASDPLNKVDAVASDGTYLYIHSYNKGLLKIGTGLGGTIQGQVYATNPEYRKGDKQKSLCFIKTNGKLYYLIPQTPSTAPRNVPSSSSSTAEFLPTDIKYEDEDEENEEEDEDEEEDDDEEEKEKDAQASGAPQSAKPVENETNLKLAVIDPVTLKEERIVTLKENFQLRSHLVADHVFLYLVTRQRKDNSKSNSSKQEADIDKFIVEIYDPSSSETVPTRTIQLMAPTEETLSTATPVAAALQTTQPAATKTKPANQYEALNSTQWEKATFYATGYHLSALLQVENNSFTKVRVFSLEDGKHVADTKIKPEPLNLVACYDSIANMMWTYADNAVDGWRNLALAPKHHFKEYPPSDTKFPSFSPEHIQSKIPASQTEQPLFAVLHVISNMDRLARQHPVYAEPIFPSKKSCNSLALSEYVHCVELDGELFRTVHSVMLQALDADLDDQLKAYILLACLKVLKINLYEIINAPKTLQEILSKPDAPFEPLRELLQKFIRSPPTAGDESRKLIQKEACHALAVGLAVFHPASQDQAALLIQLLEKPNALEEGQKYLLHTLLHQLSEAEDASNLLSVSKTEDKMDVEQSDNMDIDTSVNNNNALKRPSKLNDNVKRLLNTLIDFVFEEGLHTVDNPTPQQGPLLSHAAKFLLVLQRDIISNPLYQPYAKAYISTIFNKSRLLVEHTLVKCETSVPATVDAALKSSLLGVILQPLSLALCRKTYIQDTVLSSAILPDLLDLLKVLDNLNKLNNPARDSNKRYLKKLKNKREKAFHVETKHPYPQGKNQLKQTITIPGARALCLRFDPRSYTISPSADVLQLFKSSSLTDPIVSSKEGKPMVFSGANFSHSNIIVQGDSVTFAFTANSRPDPKNSEANRYRWGFKCRVTEFVPTDAYDPLVDYWLLDLQSVLSLVGGYYTATLIEGSKPSDYEKKSSRWIDTNLFNGGLETTEKKPEAAPLIDELISGKGDAEILYNWMEKHRGRRMISPLAKGPLERAERYIIAAMMKQLYMIEEAADFIQVLKSSTGETSMVGQTINKENFILIAQEASKIVMNLQLKGQADKLWRAAVEEKQTFESFTNFWKEEKQEKLIEMCELKGVEYDSRDEKATLERLYEQLQEDIKKRQTKMETSAEREPNSYELMAQPVVERAKLLLRMRPAKQEVEVPSAETPNPFAIHRDKPVPPSTPSGPAHQEVTLMPRSSSYYPQTEISVSKEAQKARTEQKNKAFDRRVHELRKWLQAFKGWKHWQDAGSNKKNNDVPQSPLHAISYFVQSTIDTQELEQIFKSQTTRAQSRVVGLRYLQQLLSICSFSAARHQILSSLGAPLSNGGYYLNNITTCGPELTSQVTDAFVSVFAEVLKILKEKDVDTSSKILALAMCGIAFRETDIELLRATKVFPLLQQIMSECNQAVVAKGSRKEKTNKADLAKSKEAQDTDRHDAEELAKVKILGSCAWVCFKLLATRCVSWSESDLDDNLVDAQALREVQDQIFELMCLELKSKSTLIAEGNSIREDGDQSFELLSLLCLLASSPKGFKSLSREENLLNLISILRTPATEPRAKRLALRLCAKLLPSQTKDFIPKFTQFFLDEIGSRIHFDESRRSEVVLQHSVDAMDTEEEETAAADDAELSEDEEDVEIEEEQYSVYLNAWSQGYLRLIEVCHNGLGADFFGQTGTIMDRQTAESRTQQILTEMNEEGKALLKTIPLANANLLAQTIAASGGSVTVARAPTLSEQKGGQAPASRNLKKVIKKTNPTMWISGRAAQSLTSEYVRLLRQLLDPKRSSPNWSDGTKAVLYKTLGELPAVLSGSSLTVSSDNIMNATSYNRALRCIAALAVLGGYVEVVHVGGKVEIIEPGGSKKKGTIVDLTPGTAEVIYDSDSSKSLRKIQTSKLTPAAEIDFDPQWFSLTADLVPAIMTVLKIPSSCTLPSYITADLKSRLLKVLGKLLSSPAAAQLFIENPELGPILLKAASSCDPSLRQSTMERDVTALCERLWDLKTKPQIDSEDSSVKKMTDILPHFKHSKLADLLPTGWNADKLQGFILRGLDKRKVEFIGFEPSPLGRRSFISRAPPAAQTEIVLLANAVVPLNLPEFYFEVTWEQAESSGSLMSIGFIPEGQKLWANGSFKYQANAKKTTFVGGSRRQNDYGTYFRAKNVVGCGWNRDEKIIYFTKDGVDQGAAFTNVNLGRVIPAIGLSRGVQATVNFGQDPFIFKFSPEGETKEEREKRIKEEEEKRKKEREAEESRRKKEKEDEKAAAILAAQPLVNMGFSLKQVLVALKQTGFSGPEAASNWLVENLNYNFDDEASDKEDEDKEKAKEEEKEKPTEAEVPKEENNKPKEKDEMDVDISNRDDSYNITNSQSFFLADVYALPEEQQPKKDKEGAKFASEWDDHVIPTIKAFMEKDGFSQFEVEEYVQQIRTQLNNGNEQQAKAIVLQIIGDAGANIQFPASSGPGSRSDKPTLKSEEIKTGTVLTVAKHDATVGDKGWVPQMDRTIGQTGVVKAVDHQAGLVLLQFYNSESAALNEWWYSLKSLEKADKVPEPQFADLYGESLQNRIIQSQSDLANIYARKALLSVLSHVSLKMDGPLSLREMLNVISQESITTPLLSIESHHHHGLSHHVEVMHSRLIELLQHNGNNDELIDLLVKETISGFVSAAKLDLKHDSNVTAAKPPAPAPQHFKLSNCRSLVVVFDRAGTYLPTSSQATLSFYADEACTDHIQSFSEKSKFMPFIVFGNQFWVKLNCQSATHRNNCKWKFQVVPVHPKFSLSFYLADFLMEHARKYIKNLSQVLIQLFNAVLDFIYCSKTPSVLKISSFYLLEQIVYTWKSFASNEVPIPVQRLLKLKDEMLALYDAEKKRDTIPSYSSYLQSLVELMVALKDFGALGMADEKLPPVAVPTLGKVKPEEPQDKAPVDDSLHIAIALVTNSLKGSSSELSDDKKETSPAVPSSPAPTPTTPTPVATPKIDSSFAPSPQLSDFGEQGMDDDLATALALSLVDTPQPEPAVAPSQPPQSKPEEPSFMDEDDDEDMKQALAMSLQAEQAQAPSPSEQPKPAESPKPAEPKPAEPIANLFNFSGLEVPGAQPAPAPAEGFAFGSSAPIPVPAPGIAPSPMQFNFVPPEGPAPSPPPLNTSGGSRKQVSVKRGKSPSRSLNNSTTETKPVVINLSWLNKLWSVRQSLLAIESPESHQEYFTYLVKKAWAKTRVENIKQRILLVDNLPIVDDDKRDELESILKRAFSEIATINDIYIPTDVTNRQTKGYSFIEILCPQKVDLFVTKMHRHKLKIPGFAEDPSDLRASLTSSASLPRGTLKVIRFADIDKPEDFRVTEFMQSKLVTSTKDQLSTKCRAALTEIFNTYGGIAHGALTADQLNTLQVASNGKPLTNEQIEFAFSAYKTKLVPSGTGQERALPLDGFLDLYFRQSIDAPLDTWEELTRLGYDLDLNRTTYLTLEDALESQKGWNLALDFQIAEMVEMLYTDCELGSPLQLTSSLIKPVSENKNTTALSLLANVPTPALRLRFELIKLLNTDLINVLPLINLERLHSRSLARILSNMRGVIFHSTKMSFIYEVLDKTSVQGSQPSVNIDRLKVAAKKEKSEQHAQANTTPSNAIDSAILTQTMFGIAFQQLKNSNPLYLRQKKPGGAEPHFGIKIVFKGEHVQGEGGPYRQFFTDVGKELQGTLPLLIPCPNAAQGLGENRDKWVINPSCDAPIHIAMYEFLGRLMGLAIRTGVILPLDFPSYAWKPLVGIAPEPKDLEQIDSSIYGTLRYFTRCTKEEWDAMAPEEFFTTWLSDKSKVPLMEGGENIRVTYENRLEYVRLVEQIRLHESKVQIAAIRRGLGDVVPLSLLNLCTWQDLEWKISGKPYVDINLLRRHTLCSGVSPDAAHIAYFWQTLHDFNQQDRRGFLRFAWAQERLPVNDEEFERTKTRMMIKPFAGLTDPNSAFPKADTCFFNIMLPEYTSTKVLRDRLLFAIYTDSHSMNADEPVEDELALMNHPRGGRGIAAQLLDYSSESDSE